MFDSKSPVAAFETSGYAAVVDHTHDFVEIVYVLDGKGKQIIGDKEIDLEKGDMFIISSNESHSIVPEFNADEFKWVNCIFNKDFIESELLINNSDSIAHFGNRIDVSFIINLLSSEYKRKSIYYESIMKGLVLQLIGMFRRNIDLKYVEQDAVNISQRELYIQDAVNFIQENYYKKFSLEDIAKKVRISAGYLERIFREEKATTPIYYLHSYRIEQACILLINTDKTIFEICEEVGYNDIKFFYEIFKKRTGVTPRKYAKSKKIID